MPYKIYKKPDGSYGVETKATGRVHAKSTTKENAEGQVRAMQMAEHNPKDMHGKKNGMHQMSDGHMMKDSEMEKKSKRRSKGRNKDSNTHRMPMREPSVNDFYGR